MKKTDWRSFLISILVSAVATAGLYFVDAVRQRKAADFWSERLAMQVGEQAQAFLLSARTTDDEYPIQQVVRNLTQGVDPRVIRVSLIGAKSVASDRGRVFEYRRILDSKGGGVMISITPPAIGFLGTHTTFEQDFAIALVFGVFFTLTGLALSRNRPQSEPSRADNPEVSPNAADRSRVLLREIGLRFRDTFEHARQIAIAASRSHQSVSCLRTGLHGGIQRAREAQAIVSEGLLSLQKFSELGTQSDAVQKAALLREARLSMELCRRTLRDFEIQLEPWATDADQAFQAFAGVESAAAAMDGQLPQAKAALIEQARLLQKLG